MDAGVGEKRAVAQQFAPFASVCRTFAPVYRSITLAGLRAAGTPNALPMSVPMAMEDIKAAWKYYMANDNKGRGVVLLGHSQGARRVMELLQREIDGKPEQKQLVAAYVLGFVMRVPPGADVGADLKHIGLCRTADQVGCVVSYGSYRASPPPPANARYGRSPGPNVDAACVDPVALSGMPVRAFLPVKDTINGMVLKEPAWVDMVAGIDSPFVDLPGLIKARCVKEGEFSFLSVTIDSTQRGSRPADIPFDIVSSTTGQLAADWGLHLIDVNLVMGNLLELVRRQAAAYGTK
jgi:hypothetical protein